MKRQPRAKAMLPAIKEHITIRALENDKDRTVFAHEIREEIKKKFPQQLPPTVTTIIKKISEARSHATNPLDEPWHLGILNKLDDYGIPHISADGIDAILKVQDYFMSTRGEAFWDIFKKNRMPKSRFGVLSLKLGKVSIRQAKWIAALYRITGDDPEYLWIVSFHYSFIEIISSISDTPFNTWLFDIYLAQGKKQFIKFLSEQNLYVGDNAENALNVLAKTAILKGEQK